MKFTIARSAALAGASALSVAAANPVLAQTAEETAGVGEIIVTAQKRSESANTVPLSITAATGEDLVNAGVTKPEELVKIVPALTVTKSHTNTPIYTLRGVGFQTQNLTATSPVGLYVDEVSYAYPYMASNVVFDLDRVEVLKGPQGTLYGRSTTGGVVNFITAKPKETAGGSFTVSAGNYQTYGVEGSFTGPITEGLSFRIAGKVDLREQGWQRSVTRPNDRLGKANRKALRGSLLWEPSSDFSALLTASYWKDDSDTQAPQAVGYQPARPPFADPRFAASLIVNPDDNRAADWTPLNYQPTPSRTRPPYTSDGEFYGANLRLNYSLSDSIDLTSLTSYGDVKRDDVTSVDGTAIEVLSSRNAGQVKSFSQELRLSGSSDQLNWLLGGYYSHDKLTESLATYNYDATAASSIRTINVLLKVNPGLAAALLGVPAPLVPGFTALAQANTAAFTVPQLADSFSSATFNLSGKSESYAAFGNGELDLTDQFSVGLGLRYTHNKLSNTGCTYDLNGQGLGVGVFLSTAVIRSPQTLTQGMCLTMKADYSGFSGPISGTISEDNLSFRGSLNWKPRPGMLGYASFSRGYKAGVFPALAANVASQLEPVTQERLDAYEVGMKASLLDRNVQLNVAAFYYDYKDKQVFAVIPDPVFTVLARLVNIPKSEVYGVDADLTARVAEGLQLRLAATYSHATVKEYIGFDGTAQVRDFAGASLTFAPEWTVVGAIDFTQPISDKLALNMNVSGNYQSASNSRFAGGVRTSAQAAEDALYAIKARTIFDATVGISAENWKLQAYVNNLFDTYYWTSAGSQVDSVYRFTGMPRTFGARLTFDF